MDLVRVEQSLEFPHEEHREETKSVDCKHEDDYKIKRLERELADAKGREVALRSTIERLGERLRERD